MSTETLMIKRPFLYREIGVPTEVSRAIVLDTINHQAAKIEVIVQNYRDFLGSDFWSKSMIEGLDRALASVGMMIKKVKEGPTKEPRHTEGFENHYLNVERVSPTFKYLATLFPDADDELFSTEAAVKAKKAVVKQTLNEEIAKISVMILDYIGESQEAKVTQDVILSLNYALQVGNFQLARNKKSSQDLFLKLAENNEKIEKILLEIQDLIEEITNPQNNEEIDLNLINSLDPEDYLKEIVEYVELIGNQDTSLKEIQNQIELDKAHVLLILKNRSKMESELISLLLQAIEELNIDLTELNQEKPYEHQATHSKQVFESAIETSTKEDLFSLGAFSVRYSKKDSPSFFQYIVKVSTLLGTRNLNSEQMKNQMRKHFEKVQLRAKEKDREVKAQRERAKEEEVRLERRREKDKRKEAIQRAKETALSKIQRAGFWTKLKSFFLKAT